MLVVLVLALSAHAIDLGNVVQTCKLNGKEIDPSDNSQMAKKSGKVICTNPEGKTLNEVFFVNGTPKKHTTYGDDGARTMAELDENGMRHGLLKVVEKNGKLSSEVNYNHGKEEGPVRHFYATGKIKEAYYKVNDQPVTNIEYDENGKLTALKCSNKSVVAEDRGFCGYGGKPSQVQIYNNGKVSEKVSYLKGTLKKREKLFDNGKLAREETLDGKKLSIKTYFGNGKLQAQYTTIDDAYDGKEIEFYDNGSKSKEARWAKGKELERTLFYMNGRPKKRMQFESKSGQETAKVEDFFDNGNIQHTGEYKLKPQGHWWGTSNIKDADAVPMGWHKMLRENGKFESEIQYNEKGQVTRQKEYDRMGKLAKDEQVNPDGSKK